MINNVSFIGIINRMREFDGGRGTEANPYRIVKVRHLRNAGKYSAAHYKLENDIVFTDEFEEDGEYYSDGNFWRPITSLSGTLDGQGYKIENLKSNFTGDNHNRGSFVNVLSSTGQIKNIYFKNIYVYGPNYSNSGGIVGLGSTAATHLIEGVFVDGYVRLNTWVGGIIGRACVLRRCGVNITMVASQVAGLMVGGGSTWQYVYDSYTRGSLSASNHRSAFHGASFSARLYRCYAAGVLTGGASHLRRGLISIYDGYGGGSWDSYWDKDVTTAAYSANYVGGLTVGLTTAQSKYPYPAYNVDGDQGYAGWDFDTIWAHDVDGTINNGYPYLRGVTPIP